MAPEETAASSGEDKLNPRIFFRVITVALVVVYALLFLAVVTAPLSENALGGFSGGGAVGRLCLLFLFLWAQRAWVLTSRFFERLPEKAGRENPWYSFVIACLFAMSVSGFVNGFRDPDSWGLVTGHDQPQYYAYLHSWVFDRDLDFTNEYAAIPGIEDMFAEMHPDDPGWNVAPIGSAVLWLPFYLVTHGALVVLSALGLEMPTDGIAAPYATGVAFGGLTLAGIGAWLVYRGLRKWASPVAAIFTIILLWVATPLPWYLTDEAWMSHGPSFFAGALVFFLWVRHREERSLRDWALLGGAVGLAMLVRPSHGVLLILPVADAIRRLVKHGNAATSGKQFGAALGAALLVFSPQIITWLTRSGLDGPPGSPMQWTEPALLKILFSSQHGLIAWHPVTWLGILGIAALWPKSRYAAIVVAVVLALYWYSNAAIVSWWGGTSFGMRRFVGALPFFGPGIALGGAFLVRFFKRRPWIPATGAVLLFWGYNHELTKQFREHWFDPGPAVAWEGVWSVGVAQFQNGYGHPFSYPANLLFAYAHGVTPSQYDLLGGNFQDAKNLHVEGRSLSTYLTYGWHRRRRTSLQAPGYYGAKGLRAGLILPLKIDYKYEAVLRLTIPKGMTEEQTVAVTFNGNDAGKATLSTTGPTDVRVIIDKDKIVDGFNYLDLTFGRVHTVPWGERTPLLAKGLEIHTGHPLTVSAFLRRLDVTRSEAAGAISP